MRKRKTLCKTVSLMPNDAVPKQEQRKMDVRPLQFDSDRAPTTGMTTYVVVEEGHTRVLLFHPYTMEKYELGVQEYRAAIARNRNGDDMVYWPENNTEMQFNATKCARGIEERMKDYARRKKAFPQMLCRRVIAELLDLPVADVPAFKEQSTKPRGFAVRSKKRPGVVDAIAQELTKSEGATLDEIMSSLHKTFPERPISGMRTTVRCQLKRLPTKLGLTLHSKDEKKRGIVYTLR